MNLRKSKGIVLYWAAAAALCAAVMAIPRPSQSQMGMIPGPYATFRGTVTSAHGPAPTYPGAACTVSATPSSGRYNCRIQITCGGQMLYGAGNGGYNNCQIRAGMGAMPTAQAHDRGYSFADGDPRMDAFLPNGPVTVADRIGPATWRVSIGNLTVAY